MTDVGKLLETVVTTPSGVSIPLGEVFTVTEREVLTSILRENQQYERTIAYEFRGPALLGNLIRDNEVAATALPPGDHKIYSHPLFPIKYNPCARAPIGRRPCSPPSIGWVGLGD
jgi:hypothetical protein